MGVTRPVDQGRARISLPPLLTSGRGGRISRTRSSRRKVPLSRQTKLEAVAGSATLLTAAITLPEGEDDGEPEAFWKKGVAPLQLLTNDGIYEADVVDVGATGCTGWAYTSAATRTA